MQQNKTIDKEMKKSSAEINDKEFCIFTAHLKI
jgi:hypothetical protein